MFTDSRCIALALIISLLALIISLLALIISLLAHVISLLAHVISLLAPVISLLAPVISLLAPVSSGLCSQTASLTAGLDRIQDQIGYLVISEEGVLAVSHTHYTNTTYYKHYQTNSSQLPVFFFSGFVVLVL